ncbi:hypothetical protein E3P81_03651 [Wallemia ichthyophaga]|uniref:Ribosomal RNA-processing protein 43 n=2 Tax=Wallemia ichthyophaga TaxID=245174 RepID=A0A4T0IG32_WALIC|nr:Exosome complex component RRP43 [Wallemia ichthyophaga EXF-994]TIA69982.1 hypothetical protein E3P91_03333 [Wallemia ichthyophaga]EOQ99190.1 Exosome complex component RRP43 [Wallemia ichthyophaga EXF-994]TIA79393.1 hypothetical protein E3P98_03318 [Wallemia ichthyophaga]TIA88105.1 hypothetical protein E3P97_03659 [Wallemia ichthyophaga]TIA97498.1 hypothetical protein E3P94_03281 [Wallemia ichthyophaga]
MTTFTDHTHIDAATYRRLRPREYLNRYLDSNVRIDGRSLLDFRSTSINQGSIETADGSAVVRLGNTTMVAGIKLKTALPDPSREAGYIVPNVDLNPVSNAKFKSGPPSDQAQVLSSRLNDLLLSANIVNHSQLVIEPRKAVWVVYVDVTCINYDGNALDAAMIAIVAALKNTQLPEANYDYDHEKVVANKQHYAPLSLNKVVVPSSFGWFDGKLLADLTDFEQSLCAAQITVVVNPDGSLAHLSTQGLSLGHTIEDSVNITNSAISAAQHRYASVSKLII